MSFKNEYVIVYKAGIYRETRICANSKKEAISNFKKDVGNFNIISCDIDDD